MNSDASENVELIELPGNHSPLDIAAPDVAVPVLTPGDLEVIQDMLSFSFWMGLVFGFFVFICLWEFLGIRSFLRRTLKPAVERLGDRLFDAQVARWDAKRPKWWVDHCAKVGREIPS